MSNVAETERFTALWEEDEKYKICEVETKCFQWVADEFILTRTIIHNLFIQLVVFFLLVFKYF